MSVPGFPRSGGETPSAGCGCLVVAGLFALAVVGALLALGFYATEAMDRGWQHRVKP